MSNAEGQGDVVYRWLFAIHLALELLHKMVDHAVVKVLTAQAVVATPATALTSKMPPSNVSNETSKVPPPRSKISTLRSDKNLSKHKGDDPQT